MGLLVVFPAVAVARLGLVVLVVVVAAVPRVVAGLPAVVVPPVSARTRCAFARLPLPSARRALACRPVLLGTVRVCPGGDIAALSSPGALLLLAAAAITIVARLFSFLPAAAATITTIPSATLAVVAVPALLLVAIAASVAAIITVTGTVCALHNW